MIQHSKVPPPVARLFLLAIVAFPFGTSETPLRAVSVSESIAATTSDPCALACWMGSGGSCPTDYHIAILTEVESARNVEWGTGPHYDYQCYPQSCQAKHGFDCEFIEGLEDLRTSLVTVDAQRTSSLIRQGNDRVVLNLARSAIQALNCRGEVVAHMPVSSPFARRVQSLLNE
jgi:hypothetical protein